MADDLGSARDAGGRLSFDWFRQYHGTPTDSKWRVVARRSGQHLAIVVALWTLMEDYASQQPERGSLTEWDDEVAAAALDLEPEQVRAIREAMQGLTLTGDRLTAWERRQPKREREDDSAERVRQHRQRTKDTKPDDVTPRNANETPPNAVVTEETPRLDETRLDQKDAVLLAREARQATILRVLTETGLKDDVKWMGDGRRISAWLDAGYDPDLDIVPAMRHCLARMHDPPSSLNYFDKPVAQFFAERTTPPERPPNGSSRRTVPPRGDYEANLRRNLQGVVDALADELGPGGIIAEPC